MNHDEEDDIVNPETLPIYRKGKEIFDMVRKITDLIPEDNEYLMDVKGCMLSDAAMLTVKVAGAEAGGLYDLKMENAAIIRKAARDLMVQNHSLDMFGFDFLILPVLVRSTKIPTMTFRFVVLKKIPKNEKVLLALRDSLKVIMLMPFDFCN